MTTYTCCNDTYRRDESGTWCYSWGEPVPGAADLTLASALTLRGPGAADGPLSEDDLEWATSLCGVDAPLAVPARGGGTLLIVGMTAPELNVLTMLTVADIAEMAGVSKATVDSYRYRGYLPEPQVVKGRTPLWSRPVVARWAKHRPGPGWRTDVHGTRERRPVARTLPITRAREAAEQRRRHAVAAPAAPVRMTAGR
jgi:hypothetical protein